LSSGRLGRLQNFDPALEPLFGDSQGSADHVDFFFRFRFALRQEESVRRADTDFVCDEFFRVTERKVCRNNYRAYASFFQKMRQNFFVGSRFFRFPLHLALEFAEHYEFVSVGLLTTAVDFQIAQDKRTSAIALQKDEWIRRPKLRRIEHVGIRIAVGNHEAGWFCFWFAHSLLLRRLVLRGNRIGRRNIGSLAQRSPYTRKVSFYALPVLVAKSNATVQAIREWIESGQPY